MPDPPVSLPSPSTLATPQGIAINANGYFSFVKPGGRASFNLQTFPYALRQLMGLTVDKQGTLYAFTADGIAFSTPGTAVLANTIPLNLTFPFSLFTDPTGRQYLLNGTTIAVYAPGALGTGVSSRQITIGRTTPYHLPLEIAADSAGAIYVLFSDGNLGFFPADASGADAPTMVNSLQFNTEQDTNTALAVDSKNRVYLFDAKVPNQVDIGQLQSDGTFHITGTLVDSNLATLASFPVTLATDSNDSLYLFSVNGEIDFYRAGASGNAAPAMVFSQPIAFSWGASAAVMPAGALFPSPPPAPGTIKFFPASITVSSTSPSATATVGESGFSGSFNVEGGSCMDENASPHPVAGITPAQGTVFTITGNYGSYAVMGSCDIRFYDGRGAMANLMVTVSP